jgi:hypothetical protein
MREAHALRLALDPVELARAAGIEPDPWQAALLRSRSKQRLVLASRQVGKSSTAALAALHVALFEPGALVLLVSPSLRQSGELFRKVLDSFRAVSQLMPVEAESALRIEFKNRSRIVSLPGAESTTRGFSAASLIVVDEGARVADELYAAVRPALAVSENGRLLALSTAWTRSGWFHSAWQEEGDAWERTVVRATDCPRISADFLARERAALGDAAFKAEFLCEFADENGSAFFDPDAIRAAFSDTLEPLAIA